MYRKFIIILFLASLLSSVQPAFAQQTEGPIYIVQPYDTLLSIAGRFNVSITDLMSANNIANPDDLAVDQRLIIPGLQGVSGVLNTVKVNFGDSYRNIVRRTQIPELTLRKLNRIISPNEFYVGASIIIPEQETASGMNISLSPSAGETLLELSVKGASDPWSLVEINKLNGTWDGIPGNLLYSKGEGGQQNSSGLPSAFVSAEIRDLPIKQGGTGVIKVRTQPNVILSGILVDHVLHFFPTADGSMQIALQGVHALLPPGIYPLRLDATLPDGKKQSYEQNILIVSGNYPDDPLLYVDPITIDPASTEPELQQLLLMVAEATPQKYWDGDFYSPASAYAESTFFTSRYGNRRTYIGTGTDLKVAGFHTGLDFGGGVGLAITAPAAGRVVFAGPLTVRGNATIIDHGWGVYSGFWHQSAFKVNAGDVVQQNQVIGLVGDTGRVTGAHLHWELWVNGIQVDPLDWLIQTYP